MRVFSIDQDDNFTEFEQLPFEAEHTEEVLEEWLESNPDGIPEEGRILIIGRQVQTSLRGSIDLLGLDREGNAVVVELKRDRASRDVIAQALEYAACVERLDANALEGILRVYERDEALSLADYHREYFKLAAGDTVTFNKNQHLVIVGQRIAPATRETASFLVSKGIPVTCVEFTFFKADGGERLFTREVVVSKEDGKPLRLASASQPTISEQDFLDSCDEYGRALFSRLLDWGRRHSMSVNWGSKGFSLGVMIEGSRVVICYGYPEGSTYRQSFWTALHDRFGMEKAAVAPGVVHSLQQKLDAMGLFTPAGRNSKCIVDRALTEVEIDGLVAWCDNVLDAIRTAGLRT